MTIGRTLKQHGPRLAFAAALAIAASSTVLKPAQAVDAGTAVGIGLGAAALGAAVGSAPANPYNPYYYPPGYAYPAPGYYPAAPYYPPRRCWDAYYRRYYSC